MSITHLSAPYTITAADWLLWGEAPNHLTHVAADGTESAIVNAERRGTDAMTITTADGSTYGYDAEDLITVRAPRTTFAALRAAAGRNA